MTESFDQPHPAEDVFVDFDAMGCGDLALALMRSTKSLQPGQIVKVRALDPGAQADIPAWCRLTRNPLIALDAGTHCYWIKRKDA